MKILYLHQYFVDPAGSGGTRSLEFGRRLVREGHDVTLITSTAMMSDTYRNATRTERHEIDGIHVVAIPVSYANSMGTMRRILAFVRFALRSLVATVRLPRHDVIVATSTPLTVAVPAAVARVRHRSRLVFEVRDLWPAVPIEMGYLRSPLGRWPALALERFAYAIANEIITLSPGMADGVRRIVKQRTPITVVPNSADLDRFAEAVECGPPAWWPAVDPGDGVLLYAGTLGRANHIGWIVEVLDDDDAPRNLHVVIVGAGAELSAIRDSAGRAGLLDTRVHLRGVRPKDEIVNAHHVSDACLCLFADYPSLETTSPNKLFDALAAGRPVLINYGGWQADLLSEHGCGRRLSRDPARAARELASIMKDRAGLDDMAASAKQAAQAFSRDRLYADWRDVVARTAARNM